ncbi:MAG: hypothetical protein ACLVCH_13345 [Roseburia inulinivorans]
MSTHGHQALDGYLLPVKSSAVGASFAPGISVSGQQVCGSRWQLKQTLAWILHWFRHWIF